MDKNPKEFCVKKVDSIIKAFGYYHLIDAICSIVGVRKVESVVEYIKNQSAQ